MKKQIITTNEYDFIVSEEGKLYFIKKEEAANYLTGDIRFNIAKIGKEYAQGILSDGRTIIYPKAEVEKPQRRFNVTSKDAYLAYEFCMKAKEKGKKFDFAVALGYIVSHPTQAEELANVIFNNGEVSPRGLEIWRPNFELVEDINNSIEGEGERVMPEEFVREGKRVSASTKKARSTRHVEEEGRTARRVRSSRRGPSGPKGPIVKKAIVAGIALIVLGTVTTLGALSYNRDEKDNNSVPQETVNEMTNEEFVEQMEAIIEEKLNGQYLSYEISPDGKNLVICEYFEKDNKVAFANIELDRKYSSLDKLSSTEKNNLIDFLETNPEVKSTEEYCLSNDQYGEKKKIAFNIIKDGKEVKAETYKIAKTEDGEIAFAGDPTVKFDKNSKTGYTASCVITIFKEDKVIKKTYSMDCIKGTKTEDVYNLIASEDFKGKDSKVKVEESYVMDSYSPAGLFDAKEFTLLQEIIIDPETNISEGNFAEVQKDLFEKGILEHTQKITGENTTENKTYYSFKDSTENNKVNHLLEVQYDENKNIVSVEEYVEFDAYSSDENLKDLLTFIMMQNEKTENVKADIFVKKEDPTQENDNNVVSKLSLLSMEKDGENVVSVNKLENALKITSENQAYSVEKMLQILNAILKNQYFDIGKDILQTNKNVVSESVATEEETEVKEESSEVVQKAEVKKEEVSSSEEGLAFIK